MTSCAGPAFLDNAYHTKMQTTQMYAQTSVATTVYPGDVLTLRPDCYKPVVRQLDVCTCRCVVMYVRSLQPTSVCVSRPVGLVTYDRPTCG